MKLSSISGALLSAVGMALALPAYAADYYLIVPLPAKIVDVSAINVGLNNYTLPSATAGLPYSGFDFKLLLSVNGDPDYTGYGVRWDIAAGELPAGLTLNTSTGILTGTPVASGPGVFTVRATYKTKTGEQSYQLIAADISVSLSTVTLPEAITGQAYPFFDFKTKLAVTGDPSYTLSQVAFDASPLPPGLRLSSDGVLSGTPTEKTAGQSFTVKASYKGRDGRQVYTIVVNGVTLDIRTVAAGSAHTCAVTTAGALKCWGANYSGQLGDGTTTDRFTPVDVSGLSSGVASVSLGSSHTCALTTAGAAKCWGANYSGQLGDGTPTDRVTPVAVPGLSSGVTSIAAGGAHTCALTTAGAVKCWGANYFWQLGDGTTTTQPLPVDVPGLSSGVTSIAAGIYHTCVVDTAGAVKCWGYNQQMPVAVTGLSSGVMSLAAGGAHTCALTTAGAVKCWGWNHSGQLGDGTTTNQLTPVDVSGLGSGVTSIAAGGDHSCAVTAAGAVKCWGDNGSGQLGDGTSTTRFTPVDVSGLNSGVRSMAAGTVHTCALTTAGAVKCWGYNSSGPLGNGTRINQLTPVDIASQ